MKLYHGTSAEVARLALKEGLKPRAGLTNKNGNWKHTVESNPNCVYLTSCYAGYFAHCATKDDNSTELGVLEIDTDLLDQQLLLPDEDFLEQVSRGQHWDNPRIQRPLAAIEKKLKGKGNLMKERTIWFREHIWWFGGDLWQHSVNHMGTCCHYGLIPPSAITRASIFDWEKARDIGMKLIDPSITPINYKICSDGYKAVTRWMMGEDITLAEYMHPFRPEMYPDDSVADLKVMLEEHRGVTILKGNSNAEHTAHQGKRNRARG